MRILGLLAGFDPPWTLTGGAALAGVHLGHRATQDLDLFWKGLNVLGPEHADVEALLRKACLEVERVRQASSFRRLRVCDAQEVVLVDLVADPVPGVEPPIQVEIGGRQVRVDTRHEILVNKLCALLSRTEPRDLYDVMCLVDAGGDLERALRDAPAKDSGASPMVLAWSVQQQDLKPAAVALGIDPAEVDRLRAFRDELADRLVRLAAPR